MTIQSGGKAIASGGFGCVFKPALKCEGDGTRGPGISKMLIKRYAQEEMDEIDKIKPIISKIPHNEHFFLINDINSCDPARLSTADREDFDIKCSNLTKRGYTRANINQYLHDLQILNEPDGGKEVDDWLTSSNITEKRFNTMNTSLIKLLKFGVIPMNKENLFHFDIKASNVLMDPKNHARLIDWGLIGISTKKKVIPESIEGRPIQFNVPFSSILFEPTFKTWYEGKLKQNPSITKKSPILQEQLYEIADKFFHKWRLERGEGHESYTKFLMQAVYNEDQDIIKCDFFRKTVISQLANVLLKFTNFSTKKFENKRYFTDVFQYNCDIWGLLTIYLSLFEHKTNANNKINNKTFWLSLKNILIQYLFSDNSCSERYNYNDLIKDLSNLTKAKVNLKLSPIPRIVHVPKIHTIKKKKHKKTQKHKTKRKSNKSFSWPGKRCPKGTRRNKDTGHCKKI
jgi:hypothetical protein